MHILQEALGALTLGPAQHFENLTVFPLLGPADGGSPAYDTLDAALGHATLRITETSEAGSVPEIRVQNSGDRAVLIVDGEELVGAKQNRTVNLTMLVPPHADLIVPVTCVEAGRWHARSTQFAAAARTHFASGRAAKGHQVTESLLTSGVARADQAQVWADIDAKAERLKARSSTGAMAQIFESYAARVEAYVDAIRAVDRQRGAVFAIDTVPRGMDLFDNAHAFQAVFPKLLRGYAIDALDRTMVPAPSRPRSGVEGAEVTEAAVRTFLSAVQGAEAKPFPAVGAGESWRIVSPTLSGGALVVGGRIVHASVFSR